MAPLALRNTARPLTPTILPSIPPSCCTQGDSGEDPYEPSRSLVILRCGMGTRREGLEHWRKMTTCPVLSISTLNCLGRQRCGDLKPP